MDHARRKGEGGETINADRGSDPRNDKSQGSKIQNGSGRFAVEGGSRWMAVNGSERHSGPRGPREFRNGTRVGRENTDR